MTRHIGYSVTKEGKLSFWCYPGANMHVPEVVGHVPDNVLIEGAKAVERYVHAKADEAVGKVLEAKRVRAASLQKVCVPLETVHENVMLKGVLTRTAYGGQAVWDVTLTEPLGFEARATLYCRKYGPRPMLYNELLSEDGLSPSNLALETGTKELVKMYERRRHERRFPLAYQVFHALKLIQDGGEA